MNKLKNEQSFILKGNIIYSKSPTELSVTDQGFLVCRDGISQGVFPVIPENDKHLPVIDCPDLLIIPGMTDLHLHAPQYPFRAVGMDMELLEWLETHTFPEESRYADADYAQHAYHIFAGDLKLSATTRAVAFATIHPQATALLMDELEATGLKTFVGKVNMDQNCSDIIRESNADASLHTTVRWLENSAGKYQNTRPILTPRFAPTCSAALLEGLGKLQKEYQLPVQSHLSENLSEIAWVKELFPWSLFYGDIYDHFGLFGNEAPTIMAHCVHCPDKEIERMKKNRVYIAHCPQSNVNLASGIAPVRRYLEENIPTGLGTDIAGGANLSMFRCIADAVGMSKLYWRLIDQKKKPLTIEEGFYLATAGGGSFFGKVGSFAPGYVVDALILDDKNIRTTRTFSTKERLERYIYLAEEGGRIAGKYVAGKKIF
mgnify:CR=1 FL=1